MTTLSTEIDDWFRNSPSWPIPASEIDIEAETYAFMADGTTFSKADINDAITAFVNENCT